MSNIMVINMEIKLIKKPSVKYLNEVNLINDAIRLKLNNINEIRSPKIATDYTKHEDEKLELISLKSIDFVVRSMIRLNTALNLLDNLSVVYPISLVVNENGYQLNDGNHRCAACVLRDYTHIWASVSYDSLSDTSSD